MSTTPTPTAASGIDARRVDAPGLDALGPVLIANRGEIACRIIRTLRRLGIRSVAVYSDADAQARHVRLADAAVRLGPAPAAESYLRIDRIVEAALATGSGAVHPGYGFLSENAELARACATAGLVFVGPGAESIAVMGDKITAKEAVERRGVPTVPGVAGHGLGDAVLIERAGEVGYPLLIKPSAGGGGKGMHVVEAATELPAALAAARREALAGFGDDTVFLERYLAVPRHIEVQVLADAHGTTVHLGERECSLQRRHQKVIEEAPSPLLDEATRRRIGEAACETARSVGYIGAGTVEFIVAADRPDEFFFMEMNTRLQVEHPVTEQVTGIDLVELQLRVAAGEPLPFAQEDVRLRGHSIEARVYAEDPANDFLPTGGRVELAALPDAGLPVAGLPDAGLPDAGTASGDGIRVDSSVIEGQVVSVDYDPMLAKIISTGRDREEARRRLVAALERTSVLGFPTNLSFLRRLLELPAVVAGDLDTGLIARELETLTATRIDERDLADAALVLAAAEEEGAAAGAHTDRADMTRLVRVDGRGGPIGACRSAQSSPWARRDGWRLGPLAARVFRLAASDAAEPVVVTVTGASRAAVVAVGNAPAVPASVARHGSRVTITVDGVARSRTALIARAGTSAGAGRAVEFGDGDRLRIEDRPVRAAADEEAAGDPTLVSPMPGTVTLVHRDDGAAVAAGDAVLAVEAMKMEHAIRSTVDGIVRLRVALGDHVERGQVVAVVESGSAESGSVKTAAPDEHREENDS